MNKKGSGIVWELFFPVWGFFFDLLFCLVSVVFAAFWSWKLPFQLCLCNMLELEHVINHRFCNNLVEFVTFWSWKLPFQGYLQHFRVRTSCSMQRSEEAKKQRSRKVEKQRSKELQKQRSREKQKGEKQKSKEAGKQNPKKMPKTEKKKNK